MDEKLFILDWAKKQGDNVSIAHKLRDSPSKGEYQIEENLFKAY